MLENKVLVLAVRDHDIPDVVKVDGDISNRHHHIHKLWRVMVDIWELGLRTTRNIIIDVDIRDHFWSKSFDRKVLGIQHDFDVQIVLSKISHSAEQCLGLSTDKDNARCMPPSPPRPRSIRPLVMPVEVSLPYRASVKQADRGHLERAYLE